MLCEQTGCGGLAEAAGIETLALPSSGWSVEVQQECRILKSTFETISVTDSELLASGLERPPGFPDD